MGKIIKTIDDIIYLHVPGEYMSIFNANKDEIEYLNWSDDSPCGVAVEISLKAAAELANIYDIAAARHIWQAAKIQIDVICQG